MSTRPLEWSNPVPQGRYNLVVIGAGTAGLVAAAGAATLGAKVALIERNLMGGDCLHYGCVPSKAILRTARAIHHQRNASRFGLPSVTEIAVEFSSVMQRMRQLRAQISPNDSAQRFSKLGVDVYFGQARFLSGNEVEVDCKILPFRRAIIATGARPAVPPVPGIEESNPLTNETVFSLTELPKQFAIIGGGPIGCELAQAFARLGAAVTLVERGPRLLPRDEYDAGEIVQAELIKDGVDLRLSTKLDKVETENQGKLIYLAHNGDVATKRVDAILLATGRIPNVEDLGLESAGVDYDSTGVRVDDYLRTSNRNILAAGDVCSRFQFTHAADALARIAIRNALFLGRAKASALLVPWCTYTDPEVAHVGITTQEANEQGREIQTFHQSLGEVDRAILDGEDAGFVRILTKRSSDAIVGATIVADHAGEMISEVTLAIQAGMGLGRLASVIHPYPTVADAIRRCGDHYNRTRLTPMVAAVLRTWLKWYR